MNSDSSSHDSLALDVNDVHKFYGTGRGAYHALRGFSMDVPYGTIYGFLGASGCGKTTLLRCILGRLPIQSGHILILGRPPGARGHGVPGKDVGYMPQEEALALKLRVNETMYYFGLLFEMNLKLIKLRLEFLKEFLNLPNTNQLCETLSGGEKRRVSLAAALLHEPPLLILDEPTVGVDALLRARIWDHLLDLTSSNKTTIIVTTHYIEEARQAHRVGLMRSGRLLAQAKPDDLINKYSASTLEDVFLKLSEHEVQGNKKAAKGASIQQVREEECTEDTPLLAKADTVKPPPLFSGIQCGIPRLPKLYNTAALTWKEGLKFVREPLLLFFIIINPSLQMLLLIVTYGQNLTDVKVYYTNNDHPYNSSHYNRTFHLGSTFLSHIDGDTLDLELANSRDEGIQKVKDGKAWGYFNIPPNYSQSYVKRLHTVCTSVYNNTPPPADTDLSNATIELVMDATSQQIYFTINATLNQAADLMRIDFLQEASIAPYDFNPPLQIAEYVYGGPDFKFVEFTSPGLIVGMGIGIAISLTTTNLINERLTGLFDRSYVAGVSVIEVIVSQIVAYSIIGFLQTVLVVISGVYIVGVERKGSIALVLLLTFLMLICGISFGLVVSAYIKFEDTGVHIATSVILPILTIGGVFWPTQSLDEWLNIASHLTPITYPIEAIRGILQKGYGLGDESVYLAFIIVIAWSSVFLIVAALGVHIRRF